MDLYKALSSTHAYSTFNFFTHCVNVVTKKRQRVARGVWVYSCKGTYAEKTFSPEKNNRNGKTERYADAREQKLEHFVNQKTQTDCETDIWCVTFLPKAVLSLWTHFAVCRVISHPSKNIDCPPKGC